MWHEVDCSPSVFVARPGATEEDDSKNKGVNE